eukprot:jgi/Tetstr1/431894/TSEL_021383.t1
MVVKSSKPEVAFDAAKNRKMVLKRRPEGEIREGDLEVEVEDKPTCGEGQVVVRNELISIDPTHRGWMSDIPSYMPPVQLGEAMRAGSYAEVVESKFEGLKPGDKVYAFGGVQDYAVAPGESLSKMDPGIKPEDALSAFSAIIGLTAYHGMLKICQPKAGETVVVSGAAGAVGSMAGQMAKLAGARVIGVVGTAAKAKWITEDLGFDGAINYKSDDIAAKLKELAPAGVDCYYENTGGPVSDEVYLQFNVGARMALCGLIDGYNKKNIPGPRNYAMIIMRRVKVQGFVCMDHMVEMPEMLEYMGKHVAAGEIKYKVDVREGLGNYIEVVNLLFSGGNNGKLCLRP